MKFIQAKQGINTSFVLIENFSDYKEIVRELKIQFIYAFPQPNKPVGQIFNRSIYEQTREKTKYEYPTRQQGNNIYLNKDCFGFLDNGTWFLCYSEGFIDFDEYDRALELGCSNKNDYDALIESGFDKFSEYATALNNGFNNKDEFLEAKNIGCDTKAIYQSVKSAGFADKDEYGKAQKLGIANKQEFLEYIGFDKYMQTYDLHTHDEVLLHKYLTEHIKEINNIEIIRFTSILNQIIPSTRYYYQPWFKKGIIQYERFENKITEHFNTKEYFYNKNADCFQEKPIVFSNTKIVLDGSNIAWNSGSTMNGDKPLIKNVILITKDLLNKGFISIKIYFDANIEYEIDDKETYKQLESTFKIEKVPAGEQADKYILNYAKENKTFVISNDEFSDYINKDKWFQNNLEKIKVKYKIDGNNVIYDKHIEK